MLSLKPMRINEGGATVIEYAMVAFFISIAAFSVLVKVGTSVTTLFASVNSGF